MSAKQYNSNSLLPSSGPPNFCSPDWISTFYVQLFSLCFGVLPLSQKEHYLCTSFSLSLSRFPLTGIWKRVYGGSLEKETQPQTWSSCHCLFGSILVAVLFYQETGLLLQAAAVTLSSLKPFDGGLLENISWTPSGQIRRKKLKSSSYCFHLVASLARQ